MSERDTLNRMGELYADLEAANARLLARVEEAGRVSDGLHAAVLMGSKEQASIERERDGYKALAERRGEALEAEYLNRSHCCDKCTCPSPCCVEKSTLLAATSGTGAALAAAPELTNC